MIVSFIWLMEEVGFKFQGRIKPDLNKYPVSVVFCLRKKGIYLFSMLIVQNNPVTKISHYIAVLYWQCMYRIAEHILMVCAEIRTGL